MQIIFLCMLLITANIIWADIEAPDQEARIRQLEKTLTRIQQESQSTYQQFLMIQELRRNEMSEIPQIVPLPNSPEQSIPIPNYKDLIQLKQDQQGRIDKYTTDLNHLYGRYQELEVEKRTIFEQIKSLEQKTGTIE
ncbi:hypothetical protein C7H79_07595 [Nitrosomonas supralitoralis]|uniref:Uncharacterized protein n=2 Tax=Nitrosomonas supralitoralis TaxID=2116706 RepID=A0A2P7NVR0_9PROT|nr:hypothetical protein C7H79_07595 [Nitrosomonas supralitoralis]